MLKKGAPASSAIPATIEAVAMSQTSTCGSKMIATPAMTQSSPGVIASGLKPRVLDALARISLIGHGCFASPPAVIFAITSAHFDGDLEP